jgi:hypothetical protein
MEDLYDQLEKLKSENSKLLQANKNKDIETTKDESQTTENIQTNLYLVGFLIFKKMKDFYSGLNDLEKSKLTKADIILEKYEGLITHECTSSANNVVSQMKTEISSFIHQTVDYLKDEILKLNQIIETKMKMIGESAVPYSEEEIKSSLSIENNKVKNREDEISQWETTLKEMECL